VPDEPVGSPYHIYTGDFDRVVNAREVPGIMKEADRGLPPARALNVPTWPARITAAVRLAETAKPAFVEGEAILVPVLSHLHGDLSVMVLIDQSGSMHDNILSVAGSVRWLSELFEQNSVPLAIAGFTTVGWRGGAVRRQWKAAGKPKRPGRLCALLHIRYRDFDASLAEEDFRAMAHPGVLRENVDGEAIVWAVEELTRRPERNKVLVVLSDGAPVDDSTIMENGGDFLVRHIRHVIAETEADGVVRLGAVGIEYRVDGYYSSSTDASDLSTLPVALASQIASLAEQKPALARGE
jgi:cobaltochelatase CobT